MKRMLSFIICLSLLLALFPAALAESALQTAYDEAMELVLKGDYAAAKEKFDALGIYSDAASMSYYCRGLMCAQEEDYDQAMFYMGKAGVKDSGKLSTYYNGLKFEKKGDEIDLENCSEIYVKTAIYFYQVAYGSFSGLDDFKDSWEHAEKCANIANQYAYDNKQMVPNKLDLYEEALAELKEGKWQEAQDKFYILRGYRDSYSRYYETFYCLAMELLEEGNKAEALRNLGNNLGYNDSNNKAIELRDYFTDLIQTNSMCTVGLRDDGTVLFAGSSTYGLSAAGEWTDIVKIRAVGSIVVGLKKDGTVVAVGDNSYGQCNVQDWTGIVDIAVNDDHVIGLREDGTVVAAGNNQSGQCDVQDWQGIIAIATNDFHTMGIKEDGSLIAVGLNDDGQCDVNELINLDVYSVTRALQLFLGRSHSVIVTDAHSGLAIGSDAYGQLNVVAGADAITQVVVGDYHTVMLDTGNNVHASGYNNYRQCNVGNWRDILQVATSEDHTVGVKLDGTCVATGYNAYGQCDVEDWTDILCVYAGPNMTIGLKPDGTLVTAGSGNYGQLELQDWKLWE